MANESLFSDSNAAPVSAPAATPAELELARAVAEYQDLFAHGNTPPRERFVKDHPLVSRELEAELQTLEALDSLVVPRHAPKGHFGDFEIIGEIGSGGMGIVYEARQISLNRRVALKVMRPELRMDTKAMRRFRREGLAVARLEHPNVVPVYAADFENETPYIAMELAEGRNLSRLLRQLCMSHGLSTLAEKAERGLRAVNEEPLPETAPVDWLEAATVGIDDPSGGPGDLLEASPFPPPAALGPTYFRELAEAFAGAAEGLQYAHSRGVIHRDLKPSNLILSSDGRLRLLDFGVAWVELPTELTKTKNEKVGTFPYMSPEQIQGEQVTPASDIYSLGAALYEMIGWRPPASGKTTREIERSILDRDPPAPRKLNPAVPKPLESIVLQCLRKRPARRYKSAEALAQDLRRFVRDEPPEAYPEPWSEKLARRAWQKRGFLAASAGLLCVLLTAASFAVQSYWEAQKARLEVYNTTVLDGVASLLKAQYLEPLPPLQRVSSERVAVVQPGDGASPGSGQLGMKGVTSSGILLQAGPRLFRPGPDPLAQAVQRFEDAVRQLPRQPIAHYHLARARLMQAEHQAAEEQLERVLELEPVFLPAMNLLSLAVEGTQPERARALQADVERRASLEHSPWSTAWLGAQTAVLRKEWTEAGELFDALEAGTELGDERYVGYSIDTLLARGITRIKLGRATEALADFGGAAHALPKRLEPRLLEALALRLSGKHETAARRLEQLHETAARAGHSADDVDLGAAALFRDQKEYAKSLSWILKLSDSSRTVRLLHAADLNSLQGNPEEAMAAAEEANRCEPQNLEAQLLLGYLFLEREEPAEARTWFAAAAAGVKTDPRPLVGLAACCEREEDLEGARRHLEAAVRLGRACGPAHCELGRVQARLNDIDGAIASYKAALALDPGDAITLNNLGIAFEKLEYREEALGCYEKAIAHAPEFAHPHYNLGWVFHRGGDYAEAIVEYEKAMKLGLDDGLVYANIAPCRQRCLDLDGAMTAYEAALERGYTDSEIYHNYASALYRKQRFAEATQYYEKAIAAEPRGLHSYLDLGDSYARSGEPEKALDAYERGVKVDPGFRPSQDGVAWLRLKLEKPFPEGEDLRQAITSFEAAEAPGASGGLMNALLDDYRRALAPRLASYASIDRLFDGPYSLIPETWRWRFLLPATPPGDDWTGIDHEDGDWTEGAGPFGNPAREGAGTPLEDDAGSNASLCLRASFEAAEPKTITELVLKVRSDAAFVAYLNGVEVHRRGLVEEGGVLKYKTGEEFMSSWTDETLLDAAALIPGRNVLALRVLWSSGEAQARLLRVRLDAYPPPAVNALSRAQTAYREFAAARRTEDEALRLYFEGRLLAASGRQSQRLFEQAIALDGTRPEPYIRLAEEHARKNDVVSAVAGIRSAIVAGLGRREDLWERWLRFRLIDLAEDPKDILEAHRSLGRELGSLSSGQHDVRWLLERLAAGEPLRIRCGGKDGKVGGVSWSRDRFFLGGCTSYFDKLDTQKQNLESSLDRTERSFPEDQQLIHGYRLPLPRGKYRVTLRFAEGYHKQPREREFDVLLQGEAFLENYSPSFGAAEEHHRDLEIAGGALEIDFQRRKGTPKITAIEVKRLE